MRYGSVEFAYAAPIASALAMDDGFRSWILEQTRFSLYSRTARLLWEEMAARRSKGSATWWRSHFTEKCRCQGCSGQETDILAIFEAETGQRFALHFEVKQPADRFPAHKDQAESYRARAECWTRNPPRAVVPHSEATTLLLCCEAKIAEYRPHLHKFGSIITFEEISRRFPQFYLPSSGLNTAPGHGNIPAVA